VKGISIDGIKSSLETIDPMNSSETASFLIFRMMEKLIKTKLTFVQAVTDEIKI